MNNNLREYTLTFRKRVSQTSFYTTAESNTVNLIIAMVRNEETITLFTL